MLDPGELGVRTRRVAELLAPRIQRLNDSIDQAEAWALAAETIQAATGSKIESPKRRAKGGTAGGESGSAPESKYLRFLSARQLDGLAELAVEGRGDIKVYFSKSAATFRRAAGQPVCSPSTRGWSS